MGLTALALDRRFHIQNSNSTEKQKYIPNLSFIKLFSGLGFISSAIFIFFLILKKLFLTDIKKIFSNDVYLLLFILIIVTLYLGFLFMITNFLKDE
jgi:hypothetical protein